MSRWVAVLGATLFAIGVLLATATRAHAHATLVTSTPEDGATLAEAPGEIVLEFSEEMTAPASVVVTSPTGAPLATEPAVVDGTRVVQPLADAAERGTYTYAFRVFSVDGHPVTGQQTFVVGEPSAAEPTGPARDEEEEEEAREDPGSSALRPDDDGWSRRDTQVTGAIVLFGTAAVLLLLSLRPARRPGR